MRHFFTLSVIALAALLGACGDTTTTPTTMTGEIYGVSELYNEYMVQLTDKSGLTAELLVEGKVIQTVSTTQDGTYTFKNVPPGVYGFRFFKPGYVISYDGIDTAEYSNFQFVGQGRFKTSIMFGTQMFQSTAEPDTSFWAIKPEIRYEIIKEVKEVYDIWLKDTTENGKQTYIYGDGTKETWKIKFTIDYERALPLPEMKRKVKLAIQDDDRTNTNDITLTTDANVLTTTYDYTSPNSIVRDKSGKMVSYIERPGSKTDIRAKKITLQASSLIPNGIKHKKDPQRIATSNKLTVSLID